MQIYNNTFNIRSEFYSTTSAGSSHRPEDEKVQYAAKLNFALINEDGSITSQRMHELGRGAVKQVFKFSATQVFITGEQGGIEAELKKKTAINKAAGGDSTKISHLDVTFSTTKILKKERLAAPINSIRGLFAKAFPPSEEIGYLTTAAFTDLDHAIQKNFSMKERLALASQSFEAVAQFKYPWLCSWRLKT
jgi:hypothetical protein